MRLVLVVSAAALLAASNASASDHEFTGPSADVHRAIAEAQPGATIVVRGGRLADLTIGRDDVTVVGRGGATLAGEVSVLGKGVTLTGFRVASGSHVTIEGDDAVFSKNRMGRRTLVEVLGSDRARIDDNAFGPAGLRLVGGREVVVRGNTGSKVTELIVSESENSLVEGNRIGAVRVHGADAVVRGNTALVVGVESDRALVEGNATSRQLQTRGTGVRVLANSAHGGVDVNGDGATVRSNTVKRALFGVVVHGNGSDVTGNDLSVGTENAATDMVAFAQCPGILVESTLPGGVIADNVVTHLTGTGIVVYGTGVAVTDNTVHGIAAMSSVTVIGSANTVAGNDITHERTDGATGNGILVDGDANLVRDNDIASAPVDAILVRGGAGNTITGNAVDAAAGCGIAIDALTSGTVVADCTVTACGLGLVNYADDLSLSGTEFTDNRFADVLDLGTFTLFDGNLFETMSHDAFLSPHQ